MGKQWRDKEVLKEEYTANQKSIYDIADEFGCSHETVRRWLDKHEIQKRSRQGKVPEELDNREWLREKYWDEYCSTIEIADCLGVDASTIARRLDEHGIEKRDQSEAISLSKHPDSVFKKLKDSDWLEKQYWKNERSLSDIADELGTAVDAVAKWMEKHDLERRGAHVRSGEHNHQWLGDELKCECVICATSFRKHTKDDVGKFCSTSCMGKWREENTTGENNPAWNGGYNDYYGPNWKEQRRKARKRDNYTCQRCGKTDVENKKENGRELSVHHISNKQNFDDYEKMNALSNLITLCHQCHQLLEGVPIDNRQ